MEQSLLRPYCCHKTTLFICTYLIYLTFILCISNTFNTLSLQDTFRFLGGKLVNASIRLTTEKHLFLFQRLLLMTKKKEDHFVYKQPINVMYLYLSVRLCVLLWYRSVHIQSAGCYEYH